MHRGSSVLRRMPAFACVLVALTLLLRPEPAFAHQQGRSYCTVHTVPGGVDVTIESAAAHLGPALGLGSVAPSDDQLRAASDQLLQQLEDRVTARTTGGACGVRAEAPTIETREGERIVEVKLHYDCPAGPVTLRNSFRLDVDPSSETVCAVDGAAWVFRLGLEELDVGTPPTLAQMLWSFVKSGAMHVAAGIDHVAFVVALIVAAAAHRRSLLAGLKATAAVVTGFTLGHSLTLILAGLDLVRINERFTESAIALSIVFVGIENIARQEVRLRTVTAAAFGLVHGFGFASVLAETELPRRGAVGALLAFNVGIELAQLAIVAALFPVLVYLARRPWYRSWVLVPVSATVALFGALWFVKRAAGLEFLPWLGA
jgi:hypothetical protein